MLENMIVLEDWGMTVDDSLTSHSSTTADRVLYYISGYALLQAKKEITCANCRAILQSDDDLQREEQQENDPRLSQLTDLKEFSKYIG